MSFMKVGFSKIWCTRFTALGDVALESDGDLDTSNLYRPSEFRQFPFAHSRSQSCTPTNVSVSGRHRLQTAHRTPHFSITTKVIRRRKEVLATPRHHGSTPMQAHFFSASRDDQVHGACAWRFPSQRHPTRQQNPETTLSPPLSEPPKENCNVVKRDADPEGIGLPNPSQGPDIAY